MIIASSFADIFYNNCFKNGILPIVLPEENVEILFQRVQEKRGYQLFIDLENQRVVDSHGFESYFEVTPYRKRLLQKGLDEIGSTLEFKDRIKSFEEKHRIYYTIDRNEKASI